MKKTVSTFVATAVLCLMMSVPTVEAMQCKGGDCGPGKKMEKMHQKMMKECGISKEQQKKIKVQRKEYRKQSQDIRKEVREKMEALKIELQKEKTDRNAVNAIANDLKALHAKEVDLRIERVLSVKEILTPEQHQKMIKMMEEHKRKWEGKKGRRGNHHMRGMKGHQDRDDMRDCCPHGRDDDSMEGPMHDGPPME